MTHGTIIQILHGNVRTFIIIVHETVLFNTLLPQCTASQQQQSATNNQTVSLTLTEIIVPLSP